MANSNFSQTQQAGEPCLPCQMGNQFWMENLSDNNIDAAFSVNGKVSQMLSQTASEPTVLINSLQETTGSLNLAINGQNVTFLENIDTTRLNSPEELKVGLVIGKRSTEDNPIRLSQQDAIPFAITNNQVNLTQFLPDGITEENTDIDMVMICHTVEGEGQITSEGLYVLDDQSEETLEWLMSSLAANTISSGANELGYGALFARDIAEEFGRSKMISALKELIWEGKFYVKQMPSWGGKYGIIFKGSHKSRSFLTAISYGLRNKKMTYVNSFAEVNAEYNTGGSKAGFSSAARSAAKGNLIGFVISAAFDVSDFWKDEDPEKNWGDLLGALSVTFVKVWAAGMVGLIGATFLASTAILAGAPVIVIVGIGLGIAIGVGVFLDAADNLLGVKSAVKKIGHAFAGFVSKVASSISAFVEKITTDIDSQIDSWVSEVKEELRKNDPTGYCALFCSDSLDQIDAWMRGFTGRGIGRY